MAELDKPGRDPREQLKAFEFSREIHELQDVREGMVLPGIVTNITNFRLFCGCGSSYEGACTHLELADHYIKDPTEVVSLHQHVQVRVLSVDISRQRLSLSMKTI